MPSSHSSSSRASHPQSNSSASQREEMLRQLANRTLAQFDIDPTSASEPEEDQADEWDGIRAEGSDSSQGDGRYSPAASEEDFDDAEDLHQSSEHHHQFTEASGSQLQPELIVFRDPSRPLDDESSVNPTHQSERKSFMASALKKQVNLTSAGTGNSANTSQKRNSSTREDEEVKLEHLDRSLSTLISHLSGPDKKTRGIGLEAILATTLPPVAGAKNQQRHPRKIQSGIARAQLQQSLAADRQAAAAGTVRASTAKTLTKKQKRVLDGDDGRDRRKRRERTDRPLGTARGPGGMITLSEQEIKMTTSRTGSRPKKYNR